MGLSIAIGGGVIMMTLLFIFGILSIMMFQIQVETTANSQAFDNNDEIRKTSISISGINSTVGSNLVNFTLTNEGSEKLWNFDDFDVIIRYDADISGAKTRVTEQFTYNADAFALSNSQQGESPEFNIQHVCTTIPAGSFSVTHTADTEYTTPTGEAFVRIVNTRLTGNGNSDIGIGSNHQVEDFTVYISDATDLTNQIVFTRNDNPAGAGFDVRVCYEIVDYIGLSDSDNSIKVLDRNIVTYASGLTTVTGASVTPNDDSDVVVFITGQAGEENTNTQWGETLSTAAWDEINDQPIFTRGQASGSEDDNDLSYAIVEFTGANWNIQRIEHTYIGTGLETDTAPADFIAVGSVDKTFLHTQHSSGTDSGLDSQGEEAWLSAVNEISFDLENTATFGGIVTVVWIIENTQSSGTTLNVQHISGTRSGGSSEDTFPISIPTSVRATSESSIMGENGRTTGGGTAYPRGAIAFEITADDTVTGYRSDEGNTQNYRFSVVEFSQAIACMGGTSNNIAVNEWSINCIKFDYFEPGIVNSNESPEILTKLQYPIFVNGLLEISVSTNFGNTASETTTVS